MKHSLRLAGILAAGMFMASGAALAEKPAWAGGGKPDKHEKRDNDRRDERFDERRGGAVEFRFNDDSRRVIFDYYGAQARKGKCPPGLAKKHNGCLPPGQAKKWQRGQPLPADLRYYSLPRDVLVRLPPPPPQHRYVQVAGDILMIAVGTGMVVDAVEDILR
jgi:Ni/Co efflux regulator RcnB